MTLTKDEKMSLLVLLDQEIAQCNVLHGTTHKKTLGLVDLREKIIREEVETDAGED